MVTRRTSTWKHGRKFFTFTPAAFLINTCLCRGRLFRFLDRVPKVLLSAMRKGKQLSARLRASWDADWCFSLAIFTQGRMKGVSERNGISSSWSVIADVLSPAFK